MIHRALKLLRTYHGIKQKDFAKSLGISSSYLSEIESGNKTISYDLLGKYSEILKMPISDITLFAESESLHAGGKPASIQNKITDKLLKLLEWMESISDTNEITNSKSTPKKA